MILSRRMKWVSLGLASASVLGCGDSKALVCGEGTLRVGERCILRGAYDAGADEEPSADAAEDAPESGRDAVDAGPVGDAGNGDAEQPPGPTVSGMTEGTGDGGPPLDGGTPDASSGPAVDGSTAPDAGSDAGRSDAGSQPVADREQHRLLVSDDGVALVQTANVRAMTASVRVLDNLGRSTPWSATSDQAWLTLAAGAPGELVLAADATGLALDTVHYAHVTLTSTDPTVEQTESVRVGLWTSSGSDAQTVDIAVKPAARALAADPIRPFMYVHGGGPDILVYNVHTGQLVKTLSGVAPQLGSLTPSSDGSWLYATDRTNFAIVPVNLDTGVKGTAWVPGTRPQATDYARSNGKKLVIDSAAGVLDAETGVKLADTGEGGAIAASRDGTRFCTLNLGISPYSFYCRTLVVSDVTGVRLGTRREGDGRAVSGVGSNGQDIALSPDGTRIYVASGAPYEFNVFSAETLANVQVLAGEPYPTNVEVLEDGRILAGADSAYEPIDAWLYDAQGSSQNTYRFGGYTGSLVANTLKASGDATRAVGVTDEFSRPENPTLHIRALAR